MDKETRDKYFITTVVLGTLGVIATNVLTSQRDFTVLAIESIIFIVVMYILFYAVPAIYKKIIKKIAGYRIRIRRAKLLIFALEPLKFEEGKLEILIAVRNEEFWLNSKGVYAETRFIYNYLTEGRIKWYEPSNKEAEIYIPRKKHKVLHFATVDTVNDKFYLHLGNRDIPFPKEGKYGLPVQIKGILTFWNRVSKVKMDASFDTVIEFGEKDRVTVKIERHY